MARVLITGCSSGFGKLSAAALAHRRHHVFAGCRMPDQAADLAASNDIPPGVVPLQLDVTDPDSVERAVADVCAAAGGIDVLINNAGVAIPGALEDQDEAALRQVMETNFFGALRVTRAVLPIMRAQGAGRIVMLSSLSALVGLAGEGIYAASKAALEAAAESLRFEVDRFGIQVCVLQPGAFDTGMPARIAAAETGPPGSAYRPLLEHLQARARNALGTGEDPLHVARCIADLIEREESLPFRQPVGRQAEAVVARLRVMDEAARADFIRDVNATAWWSAGQPADDA
jgi:NAD(P)-dependent dehydrogenase (short-subunit alcohol dehydrogenase family)